ncbi:MAG: DUF4838 domain-containing protein, partial [Clostridia bacterium]|nr:DUF4838 domain-containing protein [Clostridia bacterium]
KDAEKSQNRIFVGKHDSSCGFFKEIYEDLRQDGFCIITFQSDLYIFGNDNVFSRSATLYGIYEFLEKYIGVKFYSFDEEFVPKKKRFRTSGIDVRVNPDFEIRQPLYASTRRHPEFTAKMRIKDCYCPNVPGGSLSPMWGTGLGHNFFSLIPPDKYKDEHPEWFDLEPEHRQLCFSQPSLNAELVTVLKQKIAEKRDAEYFALSQEDTTTPCQCEKCRRSYEKYGVSGTMIRFVNSVAEEIEKWRKIACPNRKVYLVTFAYLFSIKPPVVKIKGGGFKPIDESCVPKENVYVFFTTIDFCFYHDLLDKRCEWNKDFKDEFDGWHYLVGDRMFVWNYGINYKHYMYPFWNFGSIASNYRYFKKNGVKHLLEHGQCESEFVEMAELRTYVSSKLMWNTRLSVKKLIREFVKAY